MQEEMKNSCGCEHEHHEHDGAHCHDHDHGHVHHEQEPHGHPHNHGGCEGHTHEHHHEHTHTHGGETHTHGHTHTHSHTHGGDEDTLAEVIALLDYMAGHNQQHAEELAGMGEKLRTMGETEAADKIAEAVADFSKSNGRLMEALGLVKQL